MSWCVVTSHLYLGVLGINVRLLSATFVRFRHTDASERKQFGYERVVKNHLPSRGPPYRREAATSNSQTFPTDASERERESDFCIVFVDFQKCLFTTLYMPESYYLKAPTCFKTQLLPLRALHKIDTSLVFYYGTISRTRDSVHQCYRGDAVLEAALSMQLDVPTMLLGNR
jgi:hypothetical protein